MPIALAPTGRVLTVRKVSAEDKVKKHLMEMGLVEGEQITVLSQVHGNVIVVLKEGRVCLDRGLASKILVA